MESNPTTVRGWLETLPNLENAPSYEGSKGLDKPCKTIWEAIAWIMNNSKGTTTKRYFRGVYDCLRHEIPPQPNQYRAYYAGYNAAKAAYKGEHVAPETHDLKFVERSDGMGIDVVFTEKPYQVKEVWEQTHDTLEGKTLVDNQLLSMLQDKAAKWDELQHTLRRLKIC